MHVTRALAAVSLLASQPTAHAGGTCGGSGGGSGYVAGASGGYVSEPTSTGPACVDSTDVVGYRTCTNYGAGWATASQLPPLFVELGLGVARFTSYLDTSSRTVTHGSESFAYRVVAPERAAARDAAMVLSLRGGIGFAGPLYGALEVGFGGLLAPARADTEMLSSGAFGSPDVAQSNGHVLQAAAVLGAQVTLGDVVASGELAAGGRVVDYGFVSSYRACLEQVWIERGGGIAEARARAEYWIGARASLGVAVGTSFVDPGAWSGGVFLRMHSRAFGGLY
jgi:hypothetical protein